MQGQFTIGCVAALLLAALSFASADAAAAGLDRDVGAGQTIVIAQSGGKTLGQAVSEVQRRYGGRIISAHTEVRNGREIHVIKVLTEKARVRTVQVPGRKVGRK